MNKYICYCYIYYCILYIYIMLKKSFKFVVGYMCILQELFMPVSCLSESIWWSIASLGRVGSSTRIVSHFHTSVRELGVFFCIRVGLSL